MKLKTKIIIPTLNGGEKLEELLRIFDPQDVYIIDSDSNDYTREIIEGFPKYKLIARREFDHGGTRNLGAGIATADGAEILLFMTQDSIPVDDKFVENLIAPIYSGNAVATFARQLPRTQATLMERFSRYFNYPDTSQIRTEKDIETLGVKAFFFSNVASAVRVDVFWEVGGFPEKIILSEDMMLAAKLLRRGHKIKYVAEAQVIHSHEYTLKQQFRRNFDVGAFFSTAGPELDGAAVTGEGFKFVREQIRYVWRHGQPALIPIVILEAAAKFTAFQLGKRQKLIPRGIKKKLSMHSYHWDK